MSVFPGKLRNDTVAPAWSLSRVPGTRSPDCSSGTRTSNGFAAAIQAIATAATATQASCRRRAARSPAERRALWGVSVAAPNGNIVESFFVPPPLTPDDRRRLLVMGKWRRHERRVVERGFFGRLIIAVEPGAIAILFSIVAVLLMRNPEHLPIAGIVGIGAICFSLYAIFLMIEPFRALRETRKPIFVVDGYLRTRGRDDLSAQGTNGYVAVLLDDRRVACEWPTTGHADLPYAIQPAYLEFSEYGGVHSVDGRETGVVPQPFPAFGIGANRPPAHTPGP